MSDSLHEQVKVPTTREQIFLAAVAFLGNQGRPATEFNKIVQDSGAAKGSLNYYMPDGQEMNTLSPAELSPKLIREEQA